MYSVWESVCPLCPSSSSTLNCPGTNLPELLSDKYKTNCMQRPRRHFCRVFADHQEGKSMGWPWIVSGYSSALKRTRSLGLYGNSGGSCPAPLWIPICMWTHFLKGEGARTEVVPKIPTSPSRAAEEMSFCLIAVCLITVLFLCSADTYILRHSHASNSKLALTGSAPDSWRNSSAHLSTTQLRENRLMWTLWWNPYQVCNWCTRFSAKITI